MCAVCVATLVCAGGPPQYDLEEVTEMLVKHWLDHMVHSLTARLGEHVVQAIEVLTNHWLDHMALK